MTSVAGEATRVGAVYVHAPFCARRCFYCDFAVTVRREGDLPAWIESVGAELRLVEAEGLFQLATRLDSLYVGGGTPSLLGPGAMRGLAELLGSERLQHPDVEWTAEANPESFTDSVARAWAEAGVNRISLGLQTFHEAALKWMGRLHGVEGPVRALEAARRAGISNVSVDLIFGLPSGLGRSWEDDLERVLALDVPHVSLYGLTIETGTALGRAVRDGRESAVDDDQYRDEFLRAAEVFANAGYVHYEVSNFARPGAEARHNGRYWDGSPYLGLGNGAHSYCEPIRRWNVREWEDYRSRLLQGKSPEGEREVVGAGAAALERAWLALRTREGIVMPEATSPPGRVGLRWRDLGLAVIDQGRLRLTAEGWLVLDRLAVEWDDATSPVDTEERPKK